MEKQALERIKAVHTGLAKTLEEKKLEHHAPKIFEILAEHIRKKRDTTYFLADYLNTALENPELSPENRATYLQALVKHQQLGLDASFLADALNTALKHGHFNKQNAGLLQETLAKHQQQGRKASLLTEPLGELMQAIKASELTQVLQHAVKKRRTPAHSLLTHLHTAIKNGVPVEHAVVIQNEIEKQLKTTPTSTLVEKLWKARKK
ncbi:hypothetical protein HY993_02750 [Candidatus Micrarchaeota archaeon]|nr:hypothetical protein [Candidatus Micrarchaeota archaeon]